MADSLLFPESLLAAELDRLIEQLPDTDQDKTTFVCGVVTAAIARISSRERLSARHWMNTAERALSSVVRKVEPQFHDTLRIQFQEAMGYR
jgi:hypothetical protein